MRWLEMLAAALFTFDVTGSGMEVALVSAARALPLLCFGAFAGVLSEAVNRKHVLIGSLVLSCVASVSVCLLALAHLAQPWQVAIAAFAGGTSWATEMATRRRMVGEAAGLQHVSRAVALDSLTGASTRMIGPVAGSLLYAHLGLVGAFGISTGCYLVAALLAKDVKHEQAPRKLSLSRVPRELLEGFAFARTQPAVLTVLGVTITMNLFAFSYVALVAPIARQVFAVPDALAGTLAAAEPLGSLLGGMILASTAPRASPRLMLIGSAIFLAVLAAMPLMPNYAMACADLTFGALGLALFNNMQTTIVLTHAPPAMRSRQMGLITVCIGSGPLGQIFVGALAAQFGPLAAVVIAGLLGLAGIAIIGILWTRSGQPSTGTDATAAPAHGGTDA